MSLQIIQDSKGKATGVYIPIAEWEYIIKCYPNIEQIQNELPQWQKDTLNERMHDIENNPEKLKPISHLFNILDQE